MWCAIVPMAWWRFSDLIIFRATCPTGILSRPCWPATRWCSNPVSSHPWWLLKPCVAGGGGVARRGAQCGTGRWSDRRAPGGIRISTGCFSPAVTRPAKCCTNSSAAGPEKILALEMGGNNPLVVWQTSDMKGRRLPHHPVGVPHHRPALHLRKALDRLRR
jgi:hypothetical protein